jgi:hypothetical protein
MLTHVFAMRLSLTRSGGFTGVMKPPLVVSSDQLSEADRKRLKALVQQAGQKPADFRWRAKDALDCI